MKEYKKARKRAQKLFLNEIFMAGLIAEVKDEIKTGVKSYNPIIRYHNKKYKIKKNIKRFIEDNIKAEMIDGKFKFTLKIGVKKYKLDPRNIPNNEDFHCTHIFTSKNDVINFNTHNYPNTKKIIRKVFMKLLVVWNAPIIECVLRDTLRGI